MPLVWPHLHGYQQERILTFLDPSRDPLGAGYHSSQASIALGSGGVIGKGWLNGTQTHLDFLPERHTDFIFAVFGEEFGLIGNAVLLVLYLLLIARALVITANASTLFTRLLAGAITLMFFTYAFVNMAMVSGLLPVVGVPLPLVSFGGTALVSAVHRARHSDERAGEPEAGEYDAAVGPLWPAPWRKIGRRAGTRLAAATQPTSQPRTSHPRHDDCATPRPSPQRPNCHRSGRSRQPTFHL